MSYHHGDLREALLRAADGLLDADGHETLSLRAVARETGVSPNAPYRHFADKDDLLAALAARGFDALAGQLADSAAHAATGDELVAMMIGAVEAAIARPRLFRLMVGHTCSTRPVARTSAAAARNALVAALPFDDRDPEALTTGLWALATGLATLFVDRGHADPASTPAETVVTVLRAMRMTGGGA